MIWKKISKGKMLLGLISATTLVATTSLTIVINNNINSSTSLTNQEKYLIDSQKNTSTNEIKPLVPAQANGQNSFLSTSQGPLVYWNNVITSLDWYGAKRWSIDFSEDGYCKISGKYNDAWKRAWFNWDYDRSRNILWVLGYGDRNNQQRLFSIDATTGKTIKIVDTGSYGTLKFISALSSGNVLMWDGATISYNAQAKLYQSNTGTVTGIAGNSASAMTNIDGNGTDNNSKYKWYFTNTIPIKSGQNLVVLMSFSTISTTDDNGAANANYNVYFVLVDDNLNLIATSGQWTQGQLVAQGMKGYRNTTISAQKDYYQLVDGTVATVIYNKIIMINPNDATAPNNVSFNTFTPSESKWILSWSFDTSENLFFKYKDDTKIYKINSTVLKTGSNSSVTAATYYDLSSGNTKMQKYARNFILYNVYGYQGQIMLVNAWYNDYINIYDSKVPNVSTEADNTDEYGLVAAITQNLSDSNSGDSKGLLNTAEAFQFSADFSIPEQILKSKLPSEIVKEDLVITNDGFITQNPKYPTPFTKIMDDENGALKVTAYIDQIPWFVKNGQMPSDINPTEITKEYSGLNIVSDRISWKDSETDYDFKNTLPTKVNIEDLKRFDPATFNINSQTIVDGYGNIIYPKKTYTIESPDDNTGKITIKAKYDYMPLGVDGINANVKSVTFSHDYNIFKIGDSKQFIFTGTTGTTTSSVDVNNVPQLSSLLENQIFPSTFVSSVSSTNNGYLQFVNTDLSAGYPTSKMNFSFVADDDNGTLKITATLPPDYYSDTKDNTFTQTYTGLNKNRNYSLNWINNPVSINKLLPSEVTDSYVFSNFLTYSGFNPLDLSIQLLPDDENGILNVNIMLQGKYNDKVKKSNGFTKYGNTWMVSHGGVIP